MFRNILAPTDGSPMSRRAIGRAVRFAKEQKARVTGFYAGPAWEPNLYAYAGEVPPGFISPVQHAQHVRKTAERHLAVVKKLAAAAGVPCRCVWIEGVFPYLEIVQAARRIEKTKLAKRPILNVRGQPATMCACPDAFRLPIAKTQDHPLL